MHNRTAMRTALISTAVLTSTHSECFGAKIRNVVSCRLPQITSLAHAKCLFKIIFGHNNFISESIFKIFATLFTTFRLQKDDKVRF